MYSINMSILLAFVVQVYTSAVPRQPPSSLQAPRLGYHPQFRLEGSHRASVSRSAATQTAPSTVGSTKADQEKVAEWATKHVVDEAAKLKVSDFPIKPEALIMKAKVFLAYDLGVGNPDLLSKDFEFVGPVVGPLSKQTYVQAVGGFNFAELYPDQNNEYHHFRVDPFEPNRVWFTARGRGTNTGGSEPSGKAYVQPPQACSLRFEPNGEVNQFTIGYVMDRRIGNTGGLGGAFGIAYAMGKPLPFPEANPWKPSKRYRMLMWLGSFMQSFRADKKTENPSESEKLFTQNSHDMVSITAAASFVLLMTGGVTFAVQRSRRGSSTMHEEAFLAA